jgi:hypothetical protein
VHAAAEPEVRGSEQAKAAMDRPIAAGAPCPVRSWEASCALTWMIERTCNQCAICDPSPTTSSPSPD